MPDSFDSFCRLWPGADPGVEDEEYASGIFKHVFDVYNFSIVSNILR